MSNVNKFRYDMFTVKNPIRFQNSTIYVWIELMSQIEKSFWDLIMWSNF